MVLRADQRSTRAREEIDPRHAHPDLPQTRIREVPEHVLRRSRESRRAAELRRRGVHLGTFLAPHGLMDRAQVEVRSVDLTQVVALRSVDEFGANALRPGRERGGRREQVLVPGHGVLEEPVHEVHVVAVKLHPACDLVAREAPAMDHELETELLHGRARAARTGRRRADVAKPAVEYAERLTKPVRHARVGTVGGAAERVAFDLVDGQLAAEAARDRLHELGEDLLRMVLLGAGDEGRVTGDVRHDKEPFHLMRWYECAALPDCVSRRRPAAAGSARRRRWVARESPSHRAPPRRP